MRYLLPLLFIATAVIADEQVSYKNYKVFKMMVKTEEELHFIQHLVESRDGVSKCTIKCFFFYKRC